MTLLTIGRPGHVVGRCNAKCYNAEHEKCGCVCGGVNHGVGLARALANVEEIAAEWGRMTLSTYDDPNPRQGRITVA